MFVNFLRYFDISDVIEFERMTIREYDIRMKVAALKRIDSLEKIHQSAWANWQVQATKTQGKREVPIYSNFKKFFDKEKMERKVLGIENDVENPKSELMSLIKKANL